MKTPVNQRHLHKKVTLPAIILCATAYLIFGPKLKGLFYLNWLSVAPLLLVLFSKKSRLRFGEPLQSANTWITKTTLIWLFQIAMIGCYLFVYHCSLTITTWPQTNPAALMTTLSHFGLFPWTLITLTAIALAYYGFIRKQDTHFSSIAPSNKNTKSTLLATITDNTSQNVTIHSISISLAIIMLSIMINYFRTVTTLKIGWGIHSAVCAGLLLILLFFFQKERFFRKVSQFKLGIAINLLAIIGVIILILGLLLGIGNIITSKKILHDYWLMNRLTGFSEYDQSLLFTLCWWGLWIPTASLVLPTLYRHLTIRQSILSTLSFPIIFTFLIHLTTIQQLFISAFQYTNNNLLINIIGGLCCLSLLLILTRKTVYPKLLHTTLPAENQYKFRPEHATLKFIVTSTLSNIIVLLIGKLSLVLWLLFYLVIIAFFVFLINTTYFYFSNQIKDIE